MTYTRVTASTPSANVWPSRSIVESACRCATNDATRVFTCTTSSPLNSTRLMPKVGHSASVGKYSATLCQTMSFIASSNTLESTVSMDNGLCASNASASRSASMKLP
ncbi:hypothetical protein D3C75_1111230 [compost metagenome]